MNGTTDRPVARLYLDTNILIALAEGEDEISKLLWQFLSVDGARICCTCELTLAELAVAPMREKNVGLLALYEGWFSSQALFDVIRLDQQVLLKAARIRAHQTSIRLPDALHLAAALSSQCSHILSADQRLPTELMDDSDGGEPNARTLLALSPDRTTLEALIKKAAHP